MSPARSARTRPAALRDGETSADAVARHVRKLVFEGRLVAGQRLPQDDIALAVGVSRIPVREAIVSLEREGWLHVENHRGAFVLPLDERAITDRFALYGRFHGFAARRAVDRMGPEDLDALGALAEHVARARSAAAMDRANTGYLAGLVGIAASDRLRAVLRSTSQIVPGNFFVTVPDSIPVAQRGIAALHAAVVAGDVDAAERASVETQAEHARSVVALVERRRAS